MKFSDFTLKQLIGKQVLWIRGGEGQGTVKMITKIQSTFSDGFTIESGDDRKFNYINGRQKAVTGRMKSVFSYCTLIEQVDVDRLKQDWQSVLEKKKLIQSINDNKHKLLRLRIEQLQYINEQLQQT